MNCTDLEKTIGCLKDGAGTPIRSVEIHTEYGKNATGGTIVVATRYTDAAGVPITLAAGETVTPGECQPVPVSALEEYLMRFDGASPAHAIAPSTGPYDAVTIENLGAYYDLGDFRPFRNQDPENTTVLYATIDLVQSDGTAFQTTVIVPPGTKTIQIDGAHIVGIARIDVADQIDGDLAGNGGIINVASLSNGSPPSTAVYATVSFTRSI
jgi:hypothetical protein